MLGNEPVMRIWVIISCRKFSWSHTNTENCNEMHCSPSLNWTHWSLIGAPVSNPSVRKQHDRRYKFFWWLEYSPILSFTLLFYWKNKNSAWSCTFKFLLSWKMFCEYFNISIYLTLAYLKALVVGCCNLASNILARTCGGWTRWEEQKIQATPSPLRSQCESRELYSSMYRLKALNLNSIALCTESWPMCAHALQRIDATGLIDSTHNGCDCKHKDYRQTCH